MPNDIWLPACKSYYLEEIEFGVLPFGAPSNGYPALLLPQQGLHDFGVLYWLVGPTIGLWAHEHRVRVTGRGKKRAHSGVKFG
jgi:hypothetical protein